MSAAPGDRVRIACLTVLGSGRAPFASGTWGSAASIVLFAPVWFLFDATSLPIRAIDAVLILGVAAAFALSVRWGEWAVAHFGRKDPKPFVLDEFAGQWTALLWMPASLWIDPRLALALLATQFFLFRVFDVLKPPPARQLESLPAGWGIAADDVAAGVFANLCGQALWRFTPLAAWVQAHVPSWG